MKLRARLEGIWIEYFEDGKVNSQINYKYGEMRGEYNIYYKRGNLKEKGYVINC